MTRREIVKSTSGQVWEYYWGTSQAAALRRCHLHWACWRGKSHPAERRGAHGARFARKRATCLFLNNRVPKWKGQDSWCLLKCYNPLEHAIFHLGERQASGQDLQLELSVYQAGAGVRSSKKSSPEGIKSEIERWVKAVSNGHGKRPPEMAQQNSSRKMKSGPCIRGRVVKTQEQLKFPTGQALFRHWCKNSHWFPQTAIFGMRCKISTF